MIHWQQIGEDDFIAHHVVYTLRVEQMDDDLWWYAVECLGNEIASNTVGTKDVAMSAAETIVKREVEK